jgi:aminoglycoside/choline kinase family phosphotransferase
LQDGSRSLIAVDAPPGTENNAAFVRLARSLRAIGLNVPRIVAEDPGRGFLLIGDLGRRLYLDHLGPETADRLYGDAIGALIALQAAGPVEGLPDYDAAFLERELRLFDEWLLTGLLGLDIDARGRAILEGAYDALIGNAVEQPQVCVHRDFHSRNLMLTERGSPGILDFQDAVRGPVTYDLVSLLRDCYIDWPAQRVEDWRDGYLNLAVQSGVLRPEDAASLPRWFDLMGAQRHLKAAGIFARLRLRDDKDGYLQYLPRTLGYVVALGPVYPEMADLAALLRERVLPRIAALPGCHSA